MQCSTTEPGAYECQAGPFVHQPVETLSHTPPVPLEGEPTEAERQWWAAESDERQRRRAHAARTHHAGRGAPFGAGAEESIDRLVDELYAASVALEGMPYGFGHPADEWGA